MASSTPPLISRDRTGVHRQASGLDHEAVDLAALSSRQMLEEYSHEGARVKSRVSSTSSNRPTRTAVTQPSTPRRRQRMAAEPNRVRGYVIGGRDGLRRVDAWAGAVRRVLR